MMPFPAGASTSADLDSSSCSSGEGRSKTRHKSSSGDSDSVATRTDSSTPTEEVTPNSEVIKASPASKGVRSRQNYGSCGVMSESYHEIFEVKGEDVDALNSSPQEEELDADLVSASCDLNTEATTLYLTEKLVQDSLRWHQDRMDGAALPDSPVHAVANRHEEIHVDADLLLALEKDARHLATSVDTLVDGLANVLQSVSALTVDALETYRDGVCKTCDEVDSNIKSMYQLMAKVEEANKAMAPAYKLGEQLKEIKRLLDMYEAIAGR